MTECKTKRFEFHALSKREVTAHFGGGDISSDAGGLLLREVEQRTGILKQFAECFTDYRKPEWIEHPVQDLLAQKAYGLGPGTADSNAPKAELQVKRHCIPKDCRVLSISILGGLHHEYHLQKVPA